MTETDLQELDSPTRMPSTEYAPVFERRAAQPRYDDVRWLAYVARLAPDDRRAAFLLPNELPGERSTPQEIRNAIATATRRAFGSQTFRIEDYQIGRIRGEMRVLLPQGREFRFDFHDELGWKATFVVGSAGEERRFPAYYRKACMNPLRCLAIGGEVDTSEVLFRPIDGEELEQIANDPQLDRLTAGAIMRLHRQYQELSRYGP